MCTNGACITPSCGGKTCNTFVPCGSGGSCVCASTTGGTGFCVDGNTPCAGLADCSSNSDCASGQICAVQSCCQRNVCVGATFCGGNTLRLRDFLAIPRRDMVNATIASPGVEV